MILLKKIIFKNKDIIISDDNTSEGLRAVISIKLSNPQFEGQTKLGKSKIKGTVQSIVF